MHIAGLGGDEQGATGVFADQRAIRQGGLSDRIHGVARCTQLLQTRGQHLPKHGISGVLGTNSPAQGFGQPEGKVGLLVHLQDRLLRWAQAEAVEQRVHGPGRLFGPGGVRFGSRQASRYDGVHRGRIV